MSQKSLFRIYEKVDQSLRYLGTELARNSAEAKALAAAKHLDDVHRADELTAFAAVNPEDYRRCDRCGYHDPSFLREVDCPNCV